MAKPTTLHIAAAALVLLAVVLVLRELEPDPAMITAARVAPAPARPDLNTGVPAACADGTCGHDHGVAPVFADREPQSRVLPDRFLEDITRDETVRIPLPDGTMVRCDDARVERDGKGVLSLQGTFTAPVPGNFFFRRQDFEGVAGKMVGHVIFEGAEMAWKVLPEGPDGGPVLKEVSIHEVVCVNYSPVPEDPREMPQDHPSTVAIPEYQDVIPLESLPGAPGVIYLDFDGSKGPHDIWSYKGDAAPSGFSNATIRDIWIRVAEDFLPFNINVTTDARVHANALPGRRIRCIITPTNWYKAGGVAYIGSYNWGGDPVCWAMNYTGDSAVTVISHEVGHTLGLYHHGYNGAEYYGGHGSGTTGWAPIMGTGYGKTLKHWSDGSYYLATRPGQKDLTTITNQNGVDFRPDDCGATLATARYLWVAPGNTVTNQQGLIETPGDIDSFRFKTTGGAVNLTAGTATAGINLDIKADIVDAATSAVVVTSDSTSSANATISTNLAAGEYLLRITGAAVGTPATSRGGYSNYGCLGSYRIDGTVAGGETHQAFAIAENSANGTLIGTITPRTVGGSPLSYTIASGNTGNILSLNASTGALTVANSTALNFETLSSQYDDPAIFELFVTITNTSTSATETVRAIVTVTDVNEPPVLAPLVSDIAVYEGTTPGVQVVDLSATDPDRFDGPVNQTIASLQSSGAAQEDQKIVGGHSTVSTLTVNQSSDSTYAGTLGGTGTHENALALTKSGAGSLTLTGATHTHNGPTTILGGKLVISGSLSGDVTAVGGTFVPHGTTAIAGNLSIGTGGSFEIAAGSSVSVSGSVTLAGDLVLTAPAGLSVGQSFNLIQKSGSQPAAGTFASLPQSAVFNASGYDWQISYSGGDGNDVVLTIVDPPSLTAIESWRQTHFGTTDNSGNAADGSDSNNDGETNLLESATGQNPHATTRAITELTPAGGNFTLTYTRSKAAFSDGYIFTIEHGDTLADPWVSAGPGERTSETAATETMTAVIAGGPAPRRFVRLKITPP